MLVGVLVGLSVVLVASLVCEYRLMKERTEQGKLLESLNNKCEELEVEKEKCNKLRQSMKELLDASGELTHDYVIIAGLLEKEIGRDEAWNRYLEKKNEEPKDINELLKDIKARKEE